MSFGGSSPPATVPPIPVPQPDDPKSVEAGRLQALEAKKQQGVGAHLLAGPSGVEEDPNTTQRKLKPGVLLTG